MTSPDGTVVWFTGLPGAGKSTLARAVASELGGRGIPRCMLDGDEVRQALVPRPGYSPVDRDHFYASLADLAALLARQGLVVLVPATAHERRFRARARDAVRRYIEVYVDTPLDECRRRALGGVYAADRAQVPGLGAVYEPPERPDVVARGGQDQAAVDQVVAMVSAG